MKISLLLLFSISFLSLSLNAQVNKTFSKLPNWEEGFFDLHFINTGNGNCNFMVFPDGTTMLIDAGIINKKDFEQAYFPLKTTSTIPNDSLLAAQWIAKYIQNAMPRNRKPTIDYALVTHFHSDHYGSLVELGKLVPINNIIDRAAPNYNYPLDLKSFLAKDTIFQNYLSFIERNKINTQALKVGSNDQIKLQFSPNNTNFSVRNVKANGTIWSGVKSNTIEYFKAEEMTDFYNGKYNENPLSLAVKISYGNFDFFSGGDNTGLEGFGFPDWYDVESPMAEAVGKVEVMTLNHHGNRDATNEYFVNLLNPKVVVQQTWCSDHPGQEVYQRLIYKSVTSEERDIFATFIHPETIVTYGPWFKNGYKSMRGHIVVRVEKGGAHYKVFVLDDESNTSQIKKEFGPYTSN